MIFGSVMACTPSVVPSSLGSITRPGSLGIISARDLGHPFETGQKYFFFFCLETKETKIQGSIFLSYKLLIPAKRFELAALKQQIFLRLIHNLLNAKKMRPPELHSCRITIDNSAYMR